MSAALDELSALLYRRLRITEPDRELDGGIHRVIGSLRPALRRFVDDELPAWLHEATAAGEGASADVVAAHLLAFLRRGLPPAAGAGSDRTVVDAASCELADVELRWAGRDRYFVPRAARLPPHAFVVAGERIAMQRLSSAPLTSGPVPRGPQRTMLVEAEPVRRVGERWVVRFELRPDPAGRSQAAIDAASLPTIVAALRAALGPGQDRLRPAAQQQLARQLRRFTRGVATETFIHRDLGRHLRRELEAHLHTEILRLDEHDADADRLHHALATARVVRDLGTRVIAPLVGIEELQRALWCKPKLVLDAGWCVSLALVPPELHAEVCRNRAQLDEWRAVLGAELLAGVDPDPAWLRGHPHLVVDSRHFDDAFEEQLVAALSPEQLQSAHLAIAADNFHALRLLRSSGIEADCIFIDPPYNTGSRAFDYHDTFSESVWISMIWDRLRLGREMLRDDGVLVATIDDREVAHLRLLIEAVFGRDNFVTQAVWHKKYARQNDATWFSTSHDHVLVAARDKARWRPNPLPRSLGTNRSYRNPDDDPRGPWQSVVYTCNKSADERPNLYYPIRHPRTGQEVWPRRNRVWAFGPEAHARNEQERRVWWGAQLERDKPRQKVFLRDLDRGVVPDTLWTREQVGDNQDAQRQLAALFGVVGGFSTPKPTRLVERVVTLGSSPGATVLDFFAGSGTTAHAVLDINRADLAEGRAPRRFVVVEAGETFDTVLVPRIKKVAYARDWAEARPTGGGGVPLVCRVAYLESYEDALEAACVRSGAARVGPPSSPIVPTIDPESLGLRWSAGSLRDPFDLHLDVCRHGERVRARVCLVDTFELLAGLRPVHRGPSVWLDADFGSDEHGQPRLLDGPRLAPVATGWRFRAIWARDREERRVLVVWRRLTTEPDRDALMLRAFVRRTIGSGPPPEHVWTNGDLGPEPPRGPDERWRMRRIEDELRRHMSAGLA